MLLIMIMMMSVAASHCIIGAVAVNLYKNNPALPVVAAATSTTTLPPPVGQASPSE